MYLVRIYLKSIRRRFEMGDSRAAPCSPYGMRDLRKDECKNDGFDLISSTGCAAGSRKGQAVAIYVYSHIV